MTATQSNDSQEQTYISAYKCTQCGSRHNTEEAVKSHIRDKSDEKHTVQNNSDLVTPVTHTATNRTFEALYVINKHAKKFSSRASTAYTNGRKSEATNHSKKKKTLYATKKEFLEQTVSLADKIGLHTIKNTEFYCLYFTDETGNSWAFHTPKKSFDERKLQGVEIDDRDILDNYEKTEEVERSNLSLEDALRYLKENHSLNANRHTPMSNLEFNQPYNDGFTGWSFL